MPIHLPTNTPLQGVELDIEEDADAFIIERDAGAPNEEGRLLDPPTLTEFPELEEELKDALKLVKKAHPKLVADKRKRDELSNAVLARVLAEKLAEYPTSVAQDRELLRKGDVKGRARMAVEVRLGEKVLLEEAIAMVKAREGGAGGEDGGERPVKKMRT